MNNEEASNIVRNMRRKVVEKYLYVANVFAKLYMFKGLVYVPSYFWT